MGPLGSTNTMAYYGLFSVISISLISGGDHPCAYYLHYFYVPWPIMGHDVDSDAHCSTTMGNDVAMDIHCDITMDNDVVMCT